MMMSPGTQNPGTRRRKAGENSFKLKIAIRSVSAHISLHPLSSCEAQDTRKSGVRRGWIRKHHKPVLVFVESDATHCSPCVANIINIPCKLECFLLPQVVPVTLWEACFSIVIISETFLPTLFFGLSFPDKRTTRRTVLSIESQAVCSLATDWEAPPTARATQQ